MIGCIINIACALISLSFCIKHHSVFELLICISLSNFYIRVATLDIKEMWQTKNNSAR